jgi:preprotein translocase subunit SecB
MEVANQPKLTFHSIDIVNVSFVSQKQNVPPNIVANLQITPKVFYPENQPNDFSIIIEMSIKIPDYYDLSIIGLGTFTIEAELSADIKKGFVNFNAPAIMFPYLRSFVSTFSSNLGKAANPIIINPHFFKGDLQEIKIPDNFLQPPI